MNKWHKVGKVVRKKDKTGSFIALGDSNSRKFPFDVDIRIRNAAGEEVFVGTNVILNVQDPRNNPNLSEEQKKKIPDFILNELYVVEKEEQP